MGNSVVCDPAGYVLVGGTFTDNLMSVGSSTLANAGSNDCFITKLDTAFHVIWARSFGGTRLDNLYQMAVGLNGSISVTGEYASRSMTLGPFNLINSDTNYTFDVFVAQLDSSGNYVWAESAGGAELDGGSGICSDQAGSMYVTGYFEDSTIVFGGQVLQHTGGPGTDDIFVVKYDASGNVAWAQSAAGNGNDWGYRLAVSSANSLYVTGLTDDSCFFGNYSISAVGVFDVFVAKLDIATGLWQLPPNDTWDLFPNPSEGEINIRLQQPIGKSVLEISSLLGQVVCRKELSGTNSIRFHIDVNPGVYFLSLTDEKGPTLGYPPCYEIVSSRNF
jgi:hypothetical protein